MAGGWEEQCRQRPLSLLTYDKYDARISLLDRLTHALQPSTHTSTHSQRGEGVTGYISLRQDAFSGCGGGGGRGGMLRGGPRIRLRAPLCGSDQQQVCGNLGCLGSGSRWAVSSWDGWV